MGAAVLVMFQFLETEGDQESTEVVEVVNLDWDSDSDQRIRSCQSARVSISQFRDCGCVYKCVYICIWSRAQWGKCSKMLTIGCSDLRGYGSSGYSPVCIKH